MDIKTRRLIIRPFTLGDVDDMHALFCLPEVMRLVGMAPALSDVGQSLSRLRRWIQHGMHHAVVLVRSQKVIGYIVILPDTEEGRGDTRALGFALHPDYQRRGYMTEAVQEVLAALRHAKLRYVWACCFRENVASRALIERCGFVFQGAGNYWAESENRTYATMKYGMDLGAEVSGDKDGDV